MTTEQRVLTALRCEQPDRVPVFLYLNPYCQSWYSDEPSYGPVLEACAQYADIIYDWYFPSGFFHTAARLERESRALANGAREDIIHTPAGELRSLRAPDWRGGGTLKRWIVDPEDVDCLLSIPFVPSRPDLTPVLNARKQTRWVVQATFSDPIGLAGWVDETTMALWTIERRDLLRAMLDEASRRILTELEYCLQHGVGPIYYFNGPEYALPPLMSPTDFEEFVVAHDTKLVELIHSYPGNHVIIHSHGRVSNFLERFAAIGTDGLNVLEPPPIGDTRLADAKERIGSSVCLIGNIQYDDIARGDEQSIERLVAAAIAKGAPSGGFILSPCAYPYERSLSEEKSKNLVHYLKMGRKYGEYPLRHV
ncbi:MAG: hypothetical protein HN742_38440 [Lentisphaerae bacterium]|jgi:hypothetical protein|nr:hypothetical protein [Lentisphaerota bacterium]MBT4816474.1 hypothetical protein [Lentisphaerota bacterium]MBT5609282.1 hypothetical protein [Lentisphaerota bacterium]MBT7059424.1 hypothetical protein [Lentisphaerota bacterium]MBT7847808.1 hypothetical protein [Lentisphaerota bacterium]